MTFLALVRHGETDWNLYGRLQGSSDIPLNDTGRRQAADAAHELGSSTWDLMVSSPLVRASETADIIGSHIGLPRTATYDGLSERHFGEAEGATDWDVYAKWPHGRYPGMEPAVELTERTRNVIDTLAAEYPHSSVIAVAHGGVIRAILESVRRRPAPRIFNAGVSTLEHDGRRWSVRSINGMEVR